MSSPNDRYPIDPKQYPNSDASAISTTTGSRTTRSAAEQYPNSDASAMDVGALSAYPALSRELDQLAASKVTVLLVGGTVELQRASARVLHDSSARAGQPCVTFDCRGLTPERAELSLFGGPAHLPVENGAIRIANEGTLYVAAVNELPLLLQPRFLRFLDDDRNVRVVASTARDLTSLVERGRFRLDLAERLSLVELVLPAGP